MSRVAWLRVKLLSWLGFKVIFVSYRRRDSSDISGRLYDRLLRRFGQCRVIKDVNSIPLGVDFRDYIERIIPFCNVILVVIGPDWVGTSDGSRQPLDDPDDLVRLELLCALKHGVRIIPVMVGDARLPAREALPEPLRFLVGRQGIALRSDPDFHSDVDRLIARL